MGLIIALLVIWLAFVIVGFAIKALLWLAIVGLVLFVVTGVYGDSQPHQLRRVVALSSRNEISCSSDNC
jgi:hypothetical protein